MMATHGYESESESEVMSNSLWPHRLQPTRLLCLWDFPGNSTGAGCHFLLQGIFPTQGSNPGLLHCRQMLYHLSHQGSQDKYPGERKAKSRYAWSLWNHIKHCKFYKNERTKNPCTWTVRLSVALRGDKLGESNPWKLKQIPKRYRKINVFLQKLAIQEHTSLCWHQGGQFCFLTTTLFIPIRGWSLFCSGEENLGLTLFSRF